MKTLSRQDLTDILYGCAILGTGGGGDLAEGFGLIDDAFAKGKEFRMVSLDEAPQDALVCTPYMLGAVSAMPAEQKKQYERLPRIDEEPILLAYRRFQSYLRQEFYGTISCELGGSNTAISFYAAAMSGHCIIDADVAGRAVPEITHSTYYFNGLPVAPIILANEFGECMICENIADDLRAEAIVRALSIVSRNDIAAIDHAMMVATLLSPAQFLWHSILVSAIDRRRKAVKTLQPPLQPQVVGLLRSGVRSVKMIGKPKTGLRSEILKLTDPGISLDHLIKSG